MNTVPFVLEHVYAGFGQCDGLLRDEGDDLCIEFQIKDAVAGLLKSAVRQVRIPIKDLVSVTLTKGWLGTTWLGVKIAIQAKRMETLKDLPTANQGRIELSIARKDRDLAEKLVAELHEYELPQEQTA